MMRQLDHKICAWDTPLDRREILTDELLDSISNGTRVLLIICDLLYVHHLLAVSAVDITE